MSEWTEVTRPTKPGAFAKLGEWLRGLPTATVVECVAEDGSWIGTYYGAGEKITLRTEGDETREDMQAAMRGELDARFGEGKYALCFIGPDEREL